MDEIQAQYERFPYPARDPADESKRLITGSPSLPAEMDHWIWGGARDWSRPLRALVAGGGTGDGLIQLAQMLTDAGRAYEITYLDLSRAARDIAEARAKTRGLKNIKFVTESLLNAKDFGAFDYIDCCGVLHHLPDPQAGFQALADALAPGGGLGLMVYAPHGRSGVYPLQRAFGAMTAGRTPEDKLKIAKRVFASVPDGHPFKRNPHLVDHKASDAGFFDLLLHASDIPFTISEVSRALEVAGLVIAGMPEPWLYDPRDVVETLPEGLSALDRMQIAEDLRGTLKTHIVYAVRADAKQKPPLGKAQAIPHLRGVPAVKLAQKVASSGALTITSGGVRHTLAVPKGAAPILAGIDGRRSLQALREGLKLDPIAFGALWSPVERSLTQFGLLHYSRVLV